MNADKRGSKNEGAKEKKVPFCSLHLALCTWPLALGTLPFAGNGKTALVLVTDANEYEEVRSVHK